MISLRLSFWTKNLANSEFPVLDKVFTGFFVLFLASEGKYKTETIDTGLYNGKSSVETNNTRNRFCI